MVNHRIFAVPTPFEITVDRRTKHQRPTRQPPDHQHNAPCRRRFFIFFPPLALATPERGSDAPRASGGPALLSGGKENEKPNLRLRGGSSVFGRWLSACVCSLRFLRLVVAAVASLVFRCSVSLRVLVWLRSLASRPLVGRFRVAFPRPFPSRRRCRRRGLFAGRSSPRLLRSLSVALGAFRLARLTASLRSSRA